MEAIREVKILCKNALLVFWKIHVKPKLREQEGAKKLRSLGKKQGIPPKNITPCTGKFMQTWSLR